MKLRKLVCKIHRSNPEKDCVSCQVAANENKIRRAAERRSIAEFRRAFTENKYGELA